MPLFEFRCEDCGHQFEVIQKMDDPAPSCPKVEPHNCGGRTKKIISRTSFHLKGGGWASEGYGK